MRENRFAKLSSVDHVTANVCMARHRFAETVFISADSQIIQNIVIVMMDQSSLTNQGVVYFHDQIVDQTDIGINVKVNVFVMLVVQVHFQVIVIVHVVQDLIGVRNVVYKFHNQIQDQMTMMIDHQDQDQVHHRQRHPDQAPGSEGDRKRREERNRNIKQKIKERRTPTPSGGTPSVVKTGYASSGCGCGG